MSGNRKQLLQIIILAGILLILIGIGVFSAPYLVPVERTGERFTYELGSAVSEDVTDYVTGRDWAVEKAVLDMSQVDATCVGTYVATLKHGFQRFAYQINIQDTTPPKLKTGTALPVLEAGEAYDAEFLGITAEDLSGQVKLGLAPVTVTMNETDPDIYQKKLSYQEPGYKKVYVQATDASGNASRLMLEVLVDEAPEILGLQHYYVSVGSEVDYLEGVTCVDTLDGDLTDALVLDASDVNEDEAGIYQVHYSGTDKYGFETKETVRVHVLEQEALQTAINTHAINRLDHTIIGAINLYDGGYYLVDDVEFIMEVMEPAFVGVSIGEGFWGSGFIVEINEENIIICTNQHVLKDSKESTIYFHDGTSIKGRTAGTNYGQDIGFVTVDMAGVPKELLDTLKTVHINKGYFDELPNNYALSLCMRTINKDGSVWRDRNGQLVWKTTVVPAGTAYREVYPITEIAIQLYSGCSGSAILDGYGNLIAMAAAHGDGHYYGIHLENILKVFEETFGRTLNYE